MNVTPIRGALVPTPRTQSVTEMLATGTLPEPGDYVFIVRHGSALVAATPGSGRVRNVSKGDGYAILRFDFGLSFTISGDTEITWYPDPMKGTA